MEKTRDANHMKMILVSQKKNLKTQTVKIYVEQKESFSQ